MRRHEALNYNESATDNDGSCESPTPGCLDLTACNFDDLANQDDGSCEYASCSGCLNPNGCNYDASALYVGPCEFPIAGYDCEGSCLHPSAYTYQSGENEGEVICDEFVILGCIDENACNFESRSANANDNSCEYLSCLVFDCANELACNYNPEADFDNGSLRF